MRGNRRKTPIFDTFRFITPEPDVRFSIGFFVRGGMTSDYVHTDFQGSSLICANLRTQRVPEVLDALPRSHGNFHLRRGLT